MEFSISSILAHMGVPAMIIAGALVLMGIASVTVVAERLITLRSSRAASRRFGAAIGQDMRGRRVDAIVAKAQEKPFKGAHLARVIRSGLGAYQHALTTSDIGGLPPAERTRRHLDRYMEEISADLRRGMNVLSSVGSTAPFVGLLGTVVGIISAFQGIANTGSGGLSAVSAGISEALIETALGLAVAIPAVLAYNYLSGKIAQEELVLNHAAGELLDTIDDWEESRTVAASPLTTRAHAREEANGASVRLKYAGARA